MEAYGIRSDSIMMRVGQIAQRRFVSISANARAGSARKLLADSKIPIIPVMDCGRLVGMISGHAIKDADPDQKVSALMTAAFFLEENRSVDYAIRYLLKHGIPRAPVVESSIGMKCIGIIASPALLNEKKKEKKGR